MFWLRDALIRHGDEEEMERFISGLVIMAETRRGLAGLSL